MKRTENFWHAFSHLWRQSIQDSLAVRPAFISFHIDIQRYLSFPFWRKENMFPKTTPISTEISIPIRGISSRSIIHERFIYHVLFLATVCLSRELSVDSRYCAIASGNNIWLRLSQVLVPNQDLSEMIRVSTRQSALQLDSLHRWSIASLIFIYQK